MDMRNRRIGLDGEWKIQIGGGPYTQEELTAELKEPEDKIQLPGSLQEQGYGNEINKDTPWVQSLYDRLWEQRKEYRCGQESGFKVPFTAQPKRHYTGQAWYYKNFRITNDDGNGKEESAMQAFFYIERTGWKSSLWLDGTYMGSLTGLCAPHEYELGALKEGEHTIVVCVDNSWQLPYRPDGHGVSDALGGTWNGMAGEIYIELQPAVYIKEIRIDTDIDKKEAGFLVSICNRTAEAEYAKICLSGEEKEVLAGPGITKASITKRYKEGAALWDEFHGNLYTESIAVHSRYGISERKERFGFRKLETKAGRFLLNHRPAYFRGNHLGGDYPLTGYMDTSRAYWEERMGAIKEWGMNFIRFHSYCPPETAFEVADEMGIYLQVECGMWNVFNSGIPMLGILEEETERILKSYGNHPSFVFLSPSNEPGGDWLEPLTDWVRRQKEKDNRRLYTVQSGWPYPVTPDKITGTDYIYFHRSGEGLKPGGTIRNSQGWYGKDYRESLLGVKYPVICHELGQWCSYPDFDVIDSFQGFLQPGNFEIYKESAKAHGVYEYNKAFAYNSGRLQLKMYKEDIEANLRTPHLYGFEMLELHDYIGQGTALIGLLDPFFKNKGYTSPEEFRQFNNATVPLLRLERRIYEQGEKIQGLLEFCHFGEKELKDIVIDCVLKEEGGLVREKLSYPVANLPIQKNFEIGMVSFPTQDLSVPKQYCLEAGIRDTDIKNHWDIFLYPKEKEEAPPEDLIYTRELTKALACLKEGRKVIFAPTENQLTYDCPPLSFKPVFWNAQMGPTYRRGMGLLCDAGHPALGEFPTKTYADWQWKDIMDYGNGINLGKIGEHVTCIVRVIDDWNRNYPLGLIFECRMNGGKLLVVSSDMEKSIPGRQLMKSLFAYAASEKFRPEKELNANDFLICFHRRDTMGTLGVAAKLLEDPKEDLSGMFDGDGESNYVSGKLGHPYRIQMRFPKEITVRGFYYLPRQNQRELEGEVKSYELQMEKDGIWETICSGSFLSTFEPQKVIWENPVKSRCFCFVAVNGFGRADTPYWSQEREGWRVERKDYQDSYFSAAEFSFIVEDELESPDISGRKTLKSVKSVTQEIDN